MNAPVDARGQRPRMVRTEAQRFFESARRELRRQLGKKTARRLVQGETTRAILWAMGAQMEELYTMAEQMGEAFEKLEGPHLDRWAALMGVER